MSNTYLIGMSSGFKLTEIGFILCFFFNVKHVGHFMHKAIRCGAVYNGEKLMITSM